MTSIDAAAEAALITANMVDDLYLREFEQGEPEPDHYLDADFLARAREWEQDHETGFDSEEDMLVAYSDYLAGEAEPRDDW